MDIAECVNDGDIGLWNKPRRHDDVGQGCNSNPSLKQEPNDDDTRRTWTKWRLGLGRGHR
jgi:hypothetical protein